jgi:hypothetical protein
VFYCLAKHRSTIVAIVSECYLRVAKALAILSFAVGRFVFLADGFRAEGIFA